MSTPSASPPSRGPRQARREVGAPDRWRVAGLAVLGVWALLLVAAVALWVRVAVLAGPDDGADGTGAADGSIRLLGAPFVLLALGILWWVWRSARHLRHDRVEGWTLPLVLGGVALVQSLVVMMPLALSSGGAGADAVAPFLAGAGLGLVSVVVAVLGRRARRRSEDRVSDPG